MAATATSSTEKAAARTRTEVRTRLGAGPGGGAGPRGPNGRGGQNGRQGGRRKNSWDSPRERYRIGMWVALASVVMLFTGLTSAYVVRLGWSSDWRPTTPPTFLWVSTTLIVASSFTIEWARKSARAGDGATARRRHFLTLLLGLGFVGAQLLAWRQLVAQGVYLKSNPHVSFFYVLTAMHGLHVLGGIAGLNYLLFRRAPRREDGGRADAAYAPAVDAVTLYWHFMGGLWVYLLLLLFLWR